MDYKVIYSPNAISDLAEAVGFVAQDDPQAALRLGRQLADDADSLARLPYRFPKFRRRANVRKLVTGQYLILYRIVQTAKVVEILQILARGAGNPAFVRTKVTTLGQEELLKSSKCFRKIISGGQTGADRAGLDFAIHAGSNSRSSGSQER